MFKRQYELQAPSKLEYRTHKAARLDTPISLANWLFLARKAPKRGLGSGLNGQFKSDFEGGTGTELNISVQFLNLN
jgi:hypothetical protein